MSDDFTHVWVKRASAKTFAVLARARTALSVREIARLADVSPDTVARVVRGLERTHQVTVRSRANRKLVQLRSRPDQVPAITAIPEITDERRVAKRRLPVRRIRAEDVTRLGWPVRMPEVLVIPESLAREANVRRPYVTFRHERPLQWLDLRPEDIAVALLDVNPLAARALFERATLDRRRLRRRIVEEGKLEAAAAVHLDERLRLPSPTNVDRIPEEQIQRQLRQNPARLAYG